MSDSGYNFYSRVLSFLYKQPEPISTVEASILPIALEARETAYIIKSENDKRTAELELRNLDRCISGMTESVLKYISIGETTFYIAPNEIEKCRNTRRGKAMEQFENILTLKGYKYTSGEYSIKIEL